MIRFIDNGDETVTDTETGLIWVKSPFDVKRTWQKALDYVACLNIGGYLGYEDWRLPNIDELMSLIDRSKYNPALPSGHPFLNVQSNFYWSSTSDAYYPNDAWVVYMWNGYVYGYNKSYGSYHVWPVCSRQKEKQK